MPLFDRPPIDAISVSNSLFSSGTFRITGGPNVTVGSDASGASVSAVGPPVFTYYDNMAPNESIMPLATPAVAYGTMLVQPLDPANERFPGVMSVNTIMLQLSVSATNTSLAAYTSGVRIGFYSRVNQTQLSTLSTASSTWNQAVSGATASVHGLRWLTFHSSQFNAQPVFIDQSRYYFAYLITSSSASHSASYIGQYHLGTQQMSGTMNAASQTAASLAHFPMMGVYTASTASLPGSIGASQLSGNQALSPLIPMVAFNNLTGAF